MQSSFQKSGKSHLVYPLKIWKKLIIPQTIFKVKTFKIQNILESLEKSHNCQFNVQIFQVLAVLKKKNPTKVKYAIKLSESLVIS